MRSIFSGKGFGKLLRIENILLTIGLLVSLLIGLITLHYQVTFGYDQARDALEALNITKGDIKIIGPMTDIPGVFHGAFYFYFLSLPYFIFQGDPQLVATFYFVLFYLTIPLCGYLAYLLFKRKDVVIVSIILYACSPLFIAFSKWLSNPGPAVLVAPGLLIVLWKYLNKQEKITACLIGILYGLMIQFNLAFGLLLLLLPVYLLVFRVKPRLLEIATFAGGLVLATLSYFLVEIKFHERGITGVIGFLTDHHKTKPFADRFGAMMERTTQLFSLSFSSIQWYLVLFLIILCVIGIFFKRKQFAGKPFLFVFIWICNIFIFSLFNTGIASSNFVFAPTIVAFAVTCAYLLVFFTPRMLVIPLVAVIVFLQAQTTVHWLMRNYTPLSIQIGINATDAKQVVEYTYQAADKKPFIIKSITNPLYINTTWSYLYQYEKGKYGYLPYWGGIDQTGYPGAGILQFPPKDNSVTTEFLIIEPHEGIPEQIITQTINNENIFSTVVETKHIGTYVIEKRLVTANKK